MHLKSKYALTEVKAHTDGDKFNSGCINDVYFLRLLRVFSTAAGVIAGLRYSIIIQEGLAINCC